LPPTTFGAPKSVKLRVNATNNELINPYFTLGSVTVKNFLISRYEITQAEWESVMGNNPSGFRGAELPVENVSWFDAVEYCNALSLKEGLTPCYSGSGNAINCDWDAGGYRLPTEAEWEYAARSGNRNFFSSAYLGNFNLDADAWYNRNSGGRTQAAGTRAPNGLGLYDMCGNVWEWCWDWFGSYSSDAQTDPRGAPAGSRRIRRGGSWINSAQSVRPTARDHLAPSSQNNSTGFRVVRNAK
jgi:formylglycine-generating enzyme required for sulfatase activity